MITKGDRVQLIEADIPWPAGTTGTVIWTELVTQTNQLKVGVTWDTNPPSDIYLTIPPAKLRTLK